METAGPCDIRVMPLGAGQDVGGSCIVVTFGGCTVMFDCGMHMTRSAADGGHFPDFRKIAPSGPYTRHIDCVIISHLFVLVTVVVVSSLLFLTTKHFLFVSISHLDHVGALPYFTERAGYDGPIYMTVCFSFLFSFITIVSPSHHHLS